MWRSGYASSRWKLSSFSRCVASAGPTVNPVGIHYLDESLRSAVFGRRQYDLQAPLVKVAQEHLENTQLLGKPTKLSKPIGDIDLPPILGQNLDEHFQKIGRQMSEPYMTWCEDFLQSMRDGHSLSAHLPSKEEWVRRSGWTRYVKGVHPEAVDFPRDRVIIFDVEVLYKDNDFAVMATAASKNAWYSWLSPWLLGETENEKQLIPLGPQKQVVVGHNIGYDRKRVLEEYNIESSGKFFMDTMSLHVATNGMCSQQRPTWMKYRTLRKEQEDNSRTSDVLVRDNAMVDTVTAGLASPEGSPDEPFGDWVYHASLNSLAEVYAHHYRTDLPDKSAREAFGILTRVEAARDSPNLLDYCAKDVILTGRVFERLLPSFRKLCPHPVSFAALRPISSLFLPVNEEWPNYVENAEAMYESSMKDILEQLQQLAEEASTFVESPEKLARALGDPWLSQLDWTVKPIRYKKAKKGEEPELAKNQKLPGKPEWYKELFPSAKQPMKLTTRSRITPLLLRMRWAGFPLIWYDSYGWCFKVPLEQVEHYRELNYRPVEERTDDNMTIFRVYHKDGGNARCVNPMAKAYLPFFENNTLSSSSNAAKFAINANIQGSYWASARERISGQMAVYQDETIDMGFETPGWGLILPKMIPMGTVTRRAVEDTWLTASNAKKNRIGSELKSLIRAPPGYKFIGADVDSEELWIAGLLGDALFGLHGGSALGWMNLEGAKKDGTDLHSRTASIMGISRDNAKVFNYGRIYGAGQNYAIRLLKHFNPKLTEIEAQTIGERLYSATKGKSTNMKLVSSKKFWRGGSESLVFNQLEGIAQQSPQRSPILGAGITEALLKDHVSLGKNNFLTSRVNWSIQSSGVDYLHLLIASMHYLTETYGIAARLLLTVHDEVRFMVKDRDVERAALALQISNLWTRAMFCQQLGMDDIPHSVAFFSLVDIDHVLRKEVDQDCITPSQPDAIRPGKAMDIYDLLETCKTLGPADASVVTKYESNAYEPRVPVIAPASADTRTIDFIRAQIALDESSLEKLEHEIKHRRLTASRLATKVRNLRFKGVKPHVVSEFGRNRTTRKDEDSSTEQRSCQGYPLQ